MSRITQIQIVLLLAAATLLGWATHRHAKQAHELAVIRARLDDQNRALAARRQELDSLRQKYEEMERIERAAGNDRLLALLRERNAATLANAEGASAPRQPRGLGSALIQALQSAEQRHAAEDARRGEIRTGMYQFFKLVGLTPEQREQYIDLSLEKERRSSNRLAALLNGTLSPADAIQKRDSDEAEYDRRSREILGDSGMNFLNGIADGMRNTEAQRLLGIIQDNMGENRLTQDQVDRIQPLIKSDIVSIKMDDVELFRPLDEWAQYCVGCQQKVLNAAADYLTAAQLDTLKAVGAYDLADRQKQMAARRAALGIN
jgi:hypothetical protein